jgi:hypothetical protein
MTVCITYDVTWLMPAYRISSTWISRPAAKTVIPFTAKITSRNRSAHTVRAERRTVPAGSPGPESASGGTAMASTVSSPAR